MLVTKYHLFDMPDPIFFHFQVRFVQNWLLSSEKKLRKTPNGSEISLQLAGPPKVIETWCNLGGIGILFPELFWPTVRKNGSVIVEKLLKFEAFIRTI